MKKHFVILVAFFSSLLATAQKNDAQFNKRLDEYLRLTKELKFDELMDYTHPKLFKIAPKEQIVQVIKQSFDNEHFSMSIDSLSIISVSENFKSNNAFYKKIVYGMDAKLALKDTASIHDKNLVETMKSGLQMGFPDGKIDFNEVTGKFDIKTSSIMIAIKDNDSTPWMFLGYQKNPAILSQLYPNEVIDHFKL